MVNYQLSLLCPDQTSTATNPSSSVFMPSRIGPCRPLHTNSGYCRSNRNCYGCCTSCMHSHRWAVPLSCIFCFRGPTSSMVDAAYDWGTRGSCRPLMITIHYIQDPLRCATLLFPAIGMEKQLPSRRLLVPNDGFRAFSSYISENRFAYLLTWSALHLVYPLFVQR